MAERKVNEYKSLLLLALVAAAAGVGAGMAVRRDGGLEVPPADAIWELEDGSKVVRAGGVEVRVRSYSIGALVNRWLTPEEEKLVANVRKALRDDAEGARFGLTELQKKQVKSLRIYAPGPPSTNQREAVAEAWQNYEAAEKADRAARKAATRAATSPGVKSATSGATSSAVPAVDTGVWKGAMQARLYAAVAGLDGEERPLAVKIGHLRRLVSAEQFELLMGREAASSSQAVTKPATQAVTKAVTKPVTNPATKPATTGSAEIFEF
jgi:hypothetical protein